MSDITISATGCSLGDFLYKNIDFSSKIFQKFLSLNNADGGLSPGKLVFTEEFEKFSTIPYKEAIKLICNNKSFDTFNLGGPAIVSLINASQILYKYNVNCNFYGAIGNDDIADKIISIITKTSVNTNKYIRFINRSPFTDVLSDPNYDHGKGERIFINNIGCAWDLSPEHLDEDFFSSNVVVFGGTALVPNIHDNLHLLLKRSKSNNCITVVNTVYDFRNEKINPSKKWPLGSTDESYQYIDLLIMDFEEAIRLSGTNNISDASLFFIQKGVSSFIITHGAKNVLCWSSGNLFQNTNDIIEMPVSQDIINELNANPSLKGDTTGCGDNFAGGIIASLVTQIINNSLMKPSIKEAIIWGIASGGFACYYAGGTYLEKNKGEKYQLLEKYYNLYKLQVNQ